MPTGRSAQAPAWCSSTRHSSSPVPIWSARSNPDLRTCSRATVLARSQKRSERHIKPRQRSRGSKSRNVPPFTKSVHDLLDDGEQIEGAARAALDARHRHYVAGGEGVEQFEQFAPVTFSR